MICIEYKTGTEMIQRVSLMRDLTLYNRKIKWFYSNMYLKPHKITLKYVLHSGVKIYYSKSYYSFKGCTIKYEWLIKRNILIIKIIQAK